MPTATPKDSVCDYFFVEIERSGDSSCLRLKGELDLGSTKILSDALAELESNSSDPVVVDLASVTFIDCSGLSVLLGAYNRACRDERDLFITNPQPPIRRIISLTGCSHLLSDSAESLKI